MDRELKLVISAIDSASATLKKLAGETQQVQKQTEDSAKKAAKVLSGQQLKSGMMDLSREIGGTVGRLAALGGQLSEVAFAAHPVTAAIKGLAFVIGLAKTAMAALRTESDRVLDSVKKSTEEYLKVSKAIGEFIEKMNLEAEGLSDVQQKRREASNLLSKYSGDLAKVNQQLAEQRAADDAVGWGISDKTKKLEEARRAILDNMDTEQKHLALLKQKEAAQKAQASIAAWGAAISAAAEATATAASEKHAEAVKKVNRALEEQTEIVGGVTGPANAEMQMESWAQMKAALEDVTRGQADALAAARAELDSWWGGFVSTMDGVKHLSATTWQTFRQGVGDAIAGAIVMGSDLSKSLENLMKTVLANIISALVQMGIERLVLAMVYKSANMTEITGRMASLSAMTYAGAFSSAASIPLIGPVIAPGIASGALAAMLAGASAAGAAGAALGAGIGALHGGMDRVPAEATYLLARGERVLSPRQNKDLTEFLRGGSGSRIGTINIMPGAKVDAALLDKPDSWWREVVAKKLLRAINSAGRSGRRTSLAYSESEGYR